MSGGQLLARTHQTNFRARMQLESARNRKDFLIPGKFKAQVVPYDAALKVAPRNGERHFILARLEHRRVEPQRALLPESLVGVVANRVGGDQPRVVGVAAVTDGPGALAVDGKAAVINKGSNSR